MGGGGGGGGKKRLVFFGKLTLLKPNSIVVSSYFLFYLITGRIHFKCFARSVYSLDLFLQGIYL